MWFAITADRRLRQALAMGINRDQIVKDVYEGNAASLPTLAPPALLGPYMSKVKGPPAFNQAGARQLLDEIGWRAGADGVRVKDGQRLEIVIGSGFPSAELQRPIPEVLQTQLRQIGAPSRSSSRACQPIVDNSLRVPSGSRCKRPDPTGSICALPRAPRQHQQYRFGPGGGVDEAMARSEQTADLVKSQEIAADGLRLAMTGPPSSHGRLTNLRGEHVEVSTSPSRNYPSQSRRGRVGYVARSALQAVPGSMHQHHRG